MNLSSQMIPLFVVIPLASAFLVSIVGERMKRVPDIFGNLTTLCLFCLSILAVREANIHGTLVYSVGAWKPPIGIAMVLDSLSAFMLVTVNLVTCCIALYGICYMERYTAKWQFYTLFLLTIAGMNGVIVTGDIFNLFVFLEIASIASYALVAFGTERHELEASFKYAVMSSVGSYFILLGIVFLYSFTSTLNMADMAAVLVQKSGSRILLAVTALLIMGFGLKAALVPFHAWLPDAHPSAPAPISAMLSGVLIKAIGVLFGCAASLTAP
ncbi:MAG: NADH/ubiquinone/plastoquinone (complex I), partial [Candidatus Omnitrophica bacterium]|nr:NADH/ubiquinone/plastoquinone (complex I) [Candidatus Omnitrophota bacterium]